MSKRIRKIGDGTRIDILPSDCVIEQSTGLPYRVTDKRGVRQGQLVAQELAGFHVSRTYRSSVVWLCLCDCGNTTYAVMSPKSSVRSCGCLSREVRGTHGATVRKDGVRSGSARSQVYRAWRTQFRQCYRPNSPGYPNVGGRGIKMCDRWVNDFAAFVEDVGLPPTPQHVLARLDYDKDYEPSNVRWMTRAEQSKKVIARTLQQRYKDKPNPSDDQLTQLVRKYPNATCKEYCELFAEATGMRLSRTKMFGRLQKLGLSRKEQKPSDDQLILLAQKYPNETQRKYCELLAKETGIRISSSNMFYRLKKLGLSRKEQKLSDDQLILLAQKYPNKTAKEYCELIAKETGMQLGQSAVCRRLQKLGFRKEKKPSDDQLILLAQQYPGETSRKYCELLAKETGIQTSHSNMFCRLQKLGLSRKEQHHARVK
jgi:transposase